MWNVRSRILLILLLLFAGLYFFRLGSVGLVDVDEPRYAEAAREMLESKNFIVPYFNYLPRYDKPILFYLYEALSMKIFGINEFAARFPSLLSGFLCLGVLFYFLKMFRGIDSALLVVLVLMSSFEFVALCRFSVTDMTLACYISSSILCFFLGYSCILNSGRFFKLQIENFTFWYILAFVFLALACLTKGPIAIILIFLVLAPFFWWIGKLEYFYKSYSFWIGFLVFLILVLPWYIAVHFATSGEFTKEFFGLHNFARYTSVVSGHKGSIFYFIPVILIGFLPWVFFLPQAIYSVVKTGLKSLLLSPDKQFPWFCLWWFIIVFLFFSISRTKLLTYILPIFPTMSIIVAVWLDKIFQKQIDKFGLVAGLGIFFLFCLIILYLCLFNLNVLLPREIKNLKLDLQIISFAFLMFVGISMAWASSHRNELTTITILLTTFLLLYFCLIGFVLPKIDKHSQYLLRTFAKSIPPEIEIATYEIVKPSLIFYSKRHVNKIDSLEKLQKRLNQKDKFAFVTKKKLLESIMLSNSYLWGQDDRYIFFTNYPSGK